jgi:hypothetical protein
MSGCTIKAAAILVALVAIIAAAPLVLGEVILRTGLIDRNPVQRVSPAGVEVGGSAPRVIGWDAVRAVEGDMAPEAAAYAGLADAAWRARLRLERGDFMLASPLFDELFTRHADAGGPTGLLINEGELQCRLAAGEVAAAVEPWLRAYRLRVVGVERAGDRPTDRGVLDADTLLCRSLPPIFAADAATLTIIEQARDAVIEPVALTAPDGDEPRPDERNAEDHEADQQNSASDPSSDAVGSSATRDPARTVAMAMLYAAAARASLGRSDPNDEVLDDDITRAAAGDEGVALVRDIVVAQADPDAAERASARVRLAAVIDTHGGTWREAWARAAIGRSLIREDGDKMRRAGVIEMLHVPARFMRSQPYLAGVCLADASQAMRDAGNDAAADQLRSELARALPGHPAADVLHGGGSSPAHTQPQPRGAGSNT